LDTQIIQRVKDEFPFVDYIEDDLDKYQVLLEPVCNYVTPPARMLDFGAGPAEKTAMFAAMGFACTAYDDLMDDWHQLGNNRQKILEFARKFDVNYVVAEGGFFPFKPGEFDVIMMHGVLEHLHDSPRELLSSLLQFLNPHGVFYATVPNATNLRKRLAVLWGKTNYQLFESYYWSIGPWRGHIREYVRQDFLQLAEFLDLEILELRGCHQMLRRLANKNTRRVYLALTKIFPDLCDTWLFIAKKKSGWKPKEKSVDNQLKLLYKKNVALHKTLVA
jgi:SAM-dependent methyltransferase